jgi:hypothetical protein
MTTTEHEDDLRALQRVFAVVFDDIAALPPDDPFREQAMAELHASVGRIVDRAQGDRRMAKQADALQARILASGRSGV